MLGDCYHPNSERFISGVVIPCNGTAIENGEHSACCVLDDLCLTNGMCQNPSDRANGYNWYWREGCTDATFTDPACPQYCTGSGDDLSNDHFIFSCPASDTESATTHWACAPSGVDVTKGIMTDGCNEPLYTFSAIGPVAYTIAGTIQPSTTSSMASSFSSPSQPSSAASYPTSTIADTTTTSAIATTPSSSSTSTSSNSSTGLSSGTKVGLGVGISLGVVLLALVGVIIMLLRRRNIEHTGGRKAHAENSHVRPGYFTPNEPQFVPPHELEAR
ncbi:hypothetical protein K505DRAFT_418954 [Melanomma pulvis-pyrius CBS 109.77]|uniref:Mid2 domain-containing protein n=1 Tax=Melanomma pulvis-pyrius CBS 109.77 TaxID=1314802 RepID=A0A6A6X620_9PLEO|nr:hypothetical protein K505DRAFT_418954 [Melanomma pulvis-pyrius CBS 109.77]